MLSLHNQYTQFTSQLWKRSQGEIGIAAPKGLAAPIEGYNHDIGVQIVKLQQLVADKEHHVHTLEEMFFHQQLGEHNGIRLKSL